VLCRFYDDGRAYVAYGHAAFQQGKPAHTAHRGFTDGQRYLTQCHGRAYRNAAAATLAGLLVDRDHPANDEDGSESACAGAYSATRAPIYVDFRHEHRNGFSISRCLSGGEITGRVRRLDIEVDKNRTPVAGARQSEMGGNRRFAGTALAAGDGYHRLASGTHFPSSP